MTPSEDRIQAEIVRWYTNTYCLAHHSPRCLIFHVPNQGQQRLTNIGVLGGVSDLIVVHTSQSQPTTPTSTQPHVLFIEVKTPTGTLSASQRAFMERIEAIGLRYYIVKSLEEFQGIIELLA
jgi:hypothetical protein